MRILKYLSLTLSALLVTLPLRAGVLTASADGDFDASLGVRRGRIVSSDLRAGGRTLTAGRQEPAFEFCINGMTVRSSDPVWRYDGVQTETLSNGGVIRTFRFKAKGALRGLTLLWDRETFPGSSFIRERLRLTASRPGLRLTNLAGKNHFLFPCYTLSVPGPVSGTEIRLGRFETRARLEENHMFHPDRIPFTVSAKEHEMKGPFVVLDCGDFRLLSSYEHASQDNSFMEERLSRYGSKNDARQGVEGDLGYTTDDDLWFISTSAVLAEPGRLVLSGRIRHGGYIDGEEIPTGRCYETVWSTLSVLEEGDDLSACLQDYVYRKISDHRASRKPLFYYNTWGMQRDQPNAQLRSCLTEERVFEEIEYCRQMGIDRFILDDGWQAAMGEWTASRKRFPNGLEPIIRRINEAGMEAGVWLSLLAVAGNLDLYKDHPEWRINDRNDAPVLVQWGHPGFDLVSGYYDVLLSALKKLVDMGVRFFKWDAVNTLSSCNPGLDHGDESASVRDRIDRYNYLFPFYVSRLARELKEYCPDVVVELDLTEHWRCMIGLMTLQDAKYFWINNGSSRYGDYTTFRSKSVRATIDEYAGILPPEVFTFAAYPMDLEGALEYNVHTILQAGHGFWGNLRKTTPEDRAYIASQLQKAKRVLARIEGCPMEHGGRLCDSPEWYLQADRSSGFALLTAFSSEPWEGEQRLDIDPSLVLGVLGHPFRTDADGVVLPLRFEGKDDSCAAFVLGDAGQGPRVVSSTGALDDVSLVDGVLQVRSSTEAVVVVHDPGTGVSRSFTVPAGETVPCLLPAPASPVTDGKAAVTVLPLGDSITQGGGNFVSYLFPLCRKLAAQGLDAEFVGPRVQRFQGIELHHCGFGGKTIEFLDTQIDSLYRLFPADVVLIHAGHNHFVENDPVGGIIAAHRSVIDKILALNPSAFIFVAQVIGSGKLPKYAYIPELNRQLEEMVLGYGSGQVRLVDAGKGFDWQTCTIGDHVHPNETGAGIIADNWFAALAPLLRSGRLTGDTRNDGTR